MNFFVDLFIPNTRNNYRARLISGSALSIYTILLIVANIFLAPSSIRPAQASLSVEQIVQLHNQQRINNGLKPLTFNPILAESAKQKGEAMIETDCWSHYCPPGTSPWKFFKDVDYLYSYAGENLAEGFIDNVVVMQAWMNSQTHRENVLKSQFTEIGIAIVYGRFQGIRDNAVVVVHFGTPANFQDLVADASKDKASVDGEDFGISIPEDGSIVNDSRPKISGPSSGNVKVEVGTESSGDIIPKGGIFTYQTETNIPDGDVVTTVKEIDGNRIDTSKFKIDTLPPALDRSKLSISSKYLESEKVSALLEYNATNNDIAKIEIISADEKFTGFRVNTDQPVFQVKVPVEVLGSTTQLIVQDKAGNESSVKLEETATELISALSNAELINLTPSRGSFISLDASSLLASPLRLILSIALIILVVLFIVDIFYLRNKYQNLNIETDKPKTGLHIATFSLLFLVVIIGNLAGNI